MKRIVLITLVLFLVSFSKNSTEKVNVFDAIQNNQIEFTATSNGSYSGGSVLVEIKKTKNIRSIFIPSGTRFKSEFNEDQDLISVEDEIIVLNSNLTKSCFGWILCPKNQYFSYS